MRAEVLAALGAWLVASNPVQAQSPAGKSFALLQSLEGGWQGTNAEGHTSRVTFRVTSGGSAVMQELIESSTGEEMITMFHLNGDQLLMTHYCSAGNQPRMSATISPDGKTIGFEFLHVTNLRQSQEGHMLRLVVRSVAPDHHTEDWTFVDQSGTQTTDHVDLRRARS
ncbi:MAG: hypothetical protein HY700_04285 [Gemmatimonadetes bacterium]|nr:hypothetical protein [Gemmatimonadota bacterium]